MNESVEYRCWNSFNRFIKFIGYCFLMGGIAALLTQVVVVINPELIESLNVAHEYNSMPAEFKYFPIFSYCFSTVVGFLIIKTKPYFPKHLDSSTDS